MGKIFAIGDIHGCLSKLNRIMGKLDIHPEGDTLVFIGDYIDRGPEPRGVIGTILDIRKNFRNVVCLMGNHEQMFLNYYTEHRDEELFMRNGGMCTLSSYGLSGSGGKESPAVPESHMEFLTTLQTYHETEDYIFVHAGLRPGIPPERQDSDDLLWIRYEFISSPYDFGKVVVFGHTPLSYSTPLIDKNKIGIDTGAVFGGKLTCIELPDMIIHQA